jgi:hypothetical protein
LTLAFGWQPGAEALACSAKSVHMSEIARAMATGIQRRLKTGLIVVEYMAIGGI